MKNLEILKKEWHQLMSELTNVTWRLKMQAGEVSLAEYKGFLRETYFQAGFNPQIQAMATAYYPQEEREIAKKFYRHAASELGHDLLALNDLKNLGVDVSIIPSENPLPETIALTAFSFYQIQFSNPVGYLGYLFHLEFLPTQNGPHYIENLVKAGVGEEATTFLKEHATVDIGHNKLMEYYIEKLIRTKNDLESVLYSMRVTAKLHSNMIDAAFVHGAKVFG